MSSFSFSCTINQKCYTGTVTFEGEQKDEISKKDLDSLIKKTILSYLEKVQDGKTSGISLKFTTKEHNQAQVELVKNVWKQLDIPQESIKLGKGENVHIRPVRVFSLLTITSALWKLAQKIYLIFQTMFSVHDPKSFGISMPRDKYERAMKILKLINNETLNSPDELSKVDKDLVQELLRQAFNNHAFTHHLHGKKNATDVEKDLDTYAFMTQKPEAVKENITAISQCLDKLNIDDLNNQWITILEGWETLEKFDDKKKTPKIKELLGIIVPSYATMSVGIFTDKYKKVLNELEDLLKQKKGFKKQVEACEKLRTGYTALQQQRAQFQHQVDKPGYEGPLTLNQVRTVDNLNREYFFLKKLKKMQLIPKEGPIFEHSERVHTARHVKRILNRLVQMFPDNIPGDFQFIDEEMEKQFKNSHAPIYSKSTGIGMMAKSLKELFKGRIFEIQPYFAGGMTHGGLFIVNDSFLSVIEVAESKYQHALAEFTAALKSVVYRPDFSKLLTPEGLDALHQIYGPKLDENAIVQKLQDLFTQNLSQFTKTHEEKLSSITIDIKQAAFAVAIGKLPNALQKKVASVYRFLFGSKKLPESNVIGVPPAHLRQAMICTQFVATIFDDVQKMVEQNLKQMYKEQVGQEPPERFLEPLIPPNIPKDLLHPTRLEEAIKEKCTVVPQPLAVRLLVKGMNK